MEKKSILSFRFVFGNLYILHARSKIERYVVDICPKDRTFEVSQLVNEC
jgi:hypothetical protein